VAEKTHRLKSGVIVAAKYYGAVSYNPGEIQKTVK
jgi:hypothetical protein